MLTGSDVLSSRADDLEYLRLDPPGLWHVHNEGAEVKRLFLLCPLAAAIQPILVLYAANSGNVVPSDLVYPMVYSIAVGVVAFALSFVALRSVAKASLSTTLFLVLFQYYGHIFTLIGVDQNNDLQWLEQRYLMLIVILIQSSALLALYKSRTDLLGLTRFVAATLVIMVLFPLGDLVAHHARSQERSPEEMREFVRAFCSIDSIHATKTNTLPDIYYIIVDSYSRSDIIKEVYGFDNSHFIDYLEQRGFYVADKSVSNYCMTNQSLPTSMNFRMPPDMPVGSLPAEPLMSRNRLFKFLKSLGYSTITYPTALDTEFSSVDLYVTGGFGFSNEFAETYWNLTPLRPFLWNTVGFSLMKIRTLNIFEHIVTIPRMKEPTATFAHLFPPHAPYVLGGTYHRDIEALNAGLMEAIDRLIEESPEPPIIVLQADHGQRELIFDRGQMSEVAMRDALGIINAYYLPNNGKSKLYDRITPVNTWRIVLDYYFGTNLGLLPDRAYLSRPDRGSRLVEVTDLLKAEWTEEQLRKEFARIEETFWSDGGRPRAP